jgi:hypothetical protein
MSNTSSLCGKPDDDVSRRSWTVKDWYTHVGAWENATGQLCFGSTMAFSAMLTQFHRVHTATSSPSGVEPVVLAVVTLGGYFSSEELGDIDIEPVMSALEQIQQDVVRSDDDEHIELVDRAHLTRLQAEVSALQQRLTSADQRVDNLQAELTDIVSAVRSLNRGKASEVRVAGDDEPQYLQRKEWVDWVLGLCDEAMSNQSAPAVKGGDSIGGECWSCKKPVTLIEWVETDGHCPHCDAEIDEAEGVKP